MVNAHGHLELSYLKGAIPPGGGFAAFAQAMGRVRQAFSPEEQAAAAADADAVMQHGGVAAAGDIANGPLAFGVKERSPIAYRTFAEVFGLRTTDASHQEPLLRHPHTGLTPHAVYSVQEELFRSLCRTGEGPLSIHFEESPAEKALFRREGPLWEWYERTGLTCDFLHHGTPARRIAAHVPADRSVILVHNCCVTQEDITVIMEHFSAPVYWCLCPRSNRYISGVRPPVDLLRRNGLKICIGTDSLASNDRLSMVDELRAVEGVPLAERLLWATQHGAEALGFDDRFGAVEPGKRPQLWLMEGLAWSDMELTDRTSLRRIL